MEDVFHLGTFWLNVSPRDLLRHVGGKLDGSFRIHGGGAQRLANFQTIANFEWLICLCVWTVVVAWLTSKCAIST